MSEQWILCIALGWTLFAIGLIGLLTRRNALSLLLALLLMFNGTGLVWGTAVSHGPAGASAPYFIFLWVALASQIIIGFAAVMAMVLAQGSPDINKTRYLRH